MKKKICVLTSVHPWNDTRIFYKEAVSLAKKYEVELHAPADFDYKEENGVKIYGLPQWKNRLIRIKTILILHLRTIKSNANIFHFHDPELIPIGLLLRLKGKKVIYDVHENIPRQILSKDHIPSKLLRRVISSLFFILEFIACLFFTKVIIAGEDILKNEKKRVIINNFPIIQKKITKNKNKVNTIVYLGRVTKIIGVEEVAEAISKINKKFIKFKIIGKFSNLEFRNKFLIKYKNFVYFLGWKSQKEAYKEVAKSLLGVVLYLPFPNHDKLRSNKIFEYMECGIPIIYSSFPDWREKLDKYEVGLAVNPTNIDEIANAIEYIIDNPKIAQQMGDNGRRAVEEKFNWKNEEKKLFALYQDVLK